MNESRRGFFGKMAAAVAALLGFARGVRPSDREPIIETPTNRNVRIAKDVVHNIRIVNQMPTQSIESATLADIVDLLRTAVRSGKDDGHEASVRVIFTNKLTNQIADRLEEFSRTQPILPYHVNGLVRLERRDDGRVIAFMGRGAAFLLPKEFGLRQKILDAHTLGSTGWILPYEAEECFGMFALRLVYGDGENRLLAELSAIAEAECLVRKWGDSSNLLDAVAGVTIPVYEWHYEPRIGAGRIEPDGPIQAIEWRP